MNSVILFALLIFTSVSRGSSTSYSDFTELDGEEFRNDFFEDEVEYTSNPEDSSQVLTTLESFQTVPSYSLTQPSDSQEKGGSGEETKDGDSSEELLKHPAEDPVPSLSALNEVNAGKSFNNFMDHPFDYHNSKVPFQHEESKPYQTPKRRDIKEWMVSEDFFDSNNVPWGVDAYYPRLGQSEYIEDSSYSEDKSQEGPSVIVAGDYKDHDTHPKHPQYFQKNYYYNYYPLVKDRTRWNSGERFGSDDSKKRVDSAVGRKIPGPNPCRQYLEFLRYAFERLDDNSEYYYEPNEDYSEEWGVRDSEKTHTVFGTQLLGPTFYIDNSGKISQVNTNGNSIQVAEGISPESKISVISKSMTKSKPVTQETITTAKEPPTTTENLSKRPGFFLHLRPNRPGIFRSLEIETQTDAHTTVSETERKPMTTTSTTTTTTTTTVAPFLLEQTTTEEDNNANTVPTTQQEFYARMGRPMDRMPFEDHDITTTVMRTPYWYHRTTILPTTLATTPPSENRIKVKTILSVEDSTEDKSDDVDCKDKMLPCPDTVNITYPLNGYCNRYVSCESGRAIRRTCPDGLHFNLIIKSCDLPHNSFCTYACPQPNGNFGIPGDCGGYFVCKNSNPEYRMCPPRMHWDINRNICTFSQLSSCPMKCFSDNEVRHYEGDCKAYIVCLNGIPYYHKCPPNTKFDKNTLVCVPDATSTCVDDPRLLTNTLNPNTLCKDVQIQLNTKSWCRSFLPFDKQKS